MKNKKDLTGLSFCRWTVISFNGLDQRGRSTWLCECNCGTRRVVRNDLLTRGVSKSCGCLAKELNAVRNVKHGHCTNNRHNGNSTYVSWKGMKQRCYNPNSDQYEHYGAIGIKVCDRWINSFINFIDDMGERPPGTTIDRINPYGNYEPNNCRWADISTQNKNKRLTNQRGPKGGSSKYKGVTKRTNGKWQASCTINGRHKYLGTFKDEKEAAIAYDSFNIILYGERAWLNQTHFAELYD